MRKPLFHIDINNINHLNGVGEIQGGLTSHLLLRGLPVPGTPLRLPHPAQTQPSTTTTSQQKKPEKKEGKV
ncbi:hypothetical protein [Methylorubrum populi]|uniref:hypothetical protein n=1 Tax=Methylorubrum populi TaxID=223967 RepID=UPI003F65B474